MIIHVAPRYQVYFGDAKDEMYPSRYQQWHSDTIFSRSPISCVAKQLQLQHLFFLKQVHGTMGYTISSYNYDSFPSFSREGDFLVTNERSIGLGIVTADCLPVIAYDRKQQVVGIAHTGWRGAVAGVVSAMVTRMHTICASNPQDVIILFGPSAKRCCYEVQPSFTQYLEHSSFFDQVLFSQGDKLFFDLPLFVEQQLSALEIKEVHKEYNMCTICDIRFYSYRRGLLAGAPDAVGRQMTIVSLK